MTQVDEDGTESEFKLAPNGSPMAFVFNTLADQYGKNSYFKVISGDMEDTLTVVNARTGDSEKLGNMFFPEGQGQHQDLQGLLRRHRRLYEARLRQDRRHPRHAGQDRPHQGHDLRRADV